MPRLAPYRLDVIAVAAALLLSGLFAAAPVLSQAPPAPTAADPAPETALSPEDQARIEAAKALFAKYVQLEESFDTAIVDLYADGALIQNKRTYPDGNVRKLEIPVEQYRSLLRQAMPLARQLDDRSSYSDVTYAVEGQGVRIEADRYSHRKDYHSPFSMLVKPSRSGEWRIYEELSESRP